MSGSLCRIDSPCFSVFFCCFFVFLYIIVTNSQSHMMDSSCNYFHDKAGLGISDTLAWVSPGKRSCVVCAPHLCTPMFTPMFTIQLNSSSLKLCSVKQSVILRFWMLCSVHLALMHRLDLASYKMTSNSWHSSRLEMRSCDGKEEIADL